MEDEMSKHMFGPLNPALGGGRVFIEDGDGEDVAEMLFEHDQVKMRAYTSLFCAAPDLLAACKAALELVEGSDPGAACDTREEAEAARCRWRESIEQSIRAAIAKAEGETK